MDWIQSLLNIPVPELQVNEGVMLNKQHPRLASGFFWGFLEDSQLNLDEVIKTCFETSHISNSAGLTPTVEQKVIC